MLNPKRARTETARPRTPSASPVNGVLTPTKAGANLARTTSPLNDQSIAGSQQISPTKGRPGSPLIERVEMDMDVEDEAWQPDFEPMPGEQHMIVEADQKADVCQSLYTSGLR